MIVCNLDYLRTQVPMSKNLQTAITFLEASSGKTFPEGRVSVDGEKVFVEVQSYETLAGEIELMEAHRRYLDIQFLVEGEETIGWVSTDEITETKSYDEANDYWLGTAPAYRISHVRLKAGQLALLYPTDMHAPRRASGSPVTVRKFVVKVAMDD